MFGRSYFPRADEREWVRMYDRNYATWQIQQGEGGRNFDTRPSTQEERDALYQAICVSNRYERWRQLQDEAQGISPSLWKGVDELLLSSLVEKKVDRPRLQPFKMKYDTLDEVRMRFNKTVLLIKGNPFLVTDQRSVKEKLYLLVEDHTGKKQYIAVEDVPDFRPAPAVYVQCKNEAGYLLRHPSRVNTQGMSAQSVGIRKVGSVELMAFRNEDLRDALTCYGKSVKWKKDYQILLDDGVLVSMRLSDKVAVYTKKQDKIVEYKGRRLGALDGNGVKLYDEDDTIQPWVKRDLLKVDLEAMS